MDLVYLIILWTFLFFLSKATKLKEYKNQITDNQFHHDTVWFILHGGFFNLLW